MYGRRIPSSDSINYGFNDNIIDNEDEVQPTVSLINNDKYYFTNIWKKDDYKVQLFDYLLILLGILSSIFVFVYFICCLNNRTVSNKITREGEKGKE